MFNKKYIAVLAVGTITISMFSSSFNTYATNNTEVTNTSNNSDTEVTNTSTNSVDMEQMKENKDMFKGNMEQMKENMKKFRTEIGNVLDKITGLSETEKTSLEQLLDSYNIEMDNIHEEMMNIDKSTLTVEEKQAFVEKMNAIHTSFLEKVKNITSNKELLKFLEQKGVMKMMNKDMFKGNMEQMKSKMEQMKPQIESGIEQKGVMKMMNKDMFKGNMEQMKSKMEQMKPQIESGIEQMRSKMEQMEVNKDVKNSMVKVGFESFELSDKGKSKVDKFYTIFKDKFSNRLDSFSVDKLEGINVKIDKYLTKVKKESVIVYQLLALKYLINDKLSTEGLDIESLLNGF